MYKSNPICFNVWDENHFSHLMWSLWCLIIVLSMWTIWKLPDMKSWSPQTNRDILYDNRARANWLLIEDRVLLMRHRDITSVISGNLMCIAETSKQIWKYQYSLFKGMMGKVGWELYTKTMYFLFWDKPSYPQSKCT